MELLYDNYEIKRENALKIVKATTSDIVGARKYIKKNNGYEFNIKRVLDILNGKDPYRIYKDEAKVMDARSQFKIVK